MNCDEWPYGHKVGNEQMAQLLRVNVRTIERVKKRFSEGGCQAVLKRKPSRHTYKRKVDGEVEARLIHCSEPPKGYGRWSLRLLAHKLVELPYVDSISHVTVGAVLKKMSLSLGK